MWRTFAPLIIGWRTQKLRLEASGVTTCCHATLPSASLMQSKAASLMMDCSSCFSTAVGACLGALFVVGTCGFCVYFPGAVRTFIIMRSGPCSLYLLSCTKDQGFSPQSRNQVKHLPSAWGSLLSLLGLRGYLNVLHEWMRKFAAQLKTSTDTTQHKLLDTQNSLMAPPTVQPKLAHVSGSQQIDLRTTQYM